MVPPPGACVFDYQSKIAGSVVGIRSRVGQGTHVRHSLVLGADYYESLEEIDRARVKGLPPVGIGEDSVIERAIIDKNARVGRGVRIVNEAAVRMMGLKDPVAKRFSIWDHKGVIIGIVKDFNNRPLSQAITPTAITLLPNWAPSVMFVRVWPENIARTMDRIEETWRRHCPGQPFEPVFLDDSFDDLYRSDRRVGALLPVGLAIVDAEGGIVRATAAFDRIWGKGRPVARSVADYQLYKARWIDTGREILPEEWASTRAVRQGETVDGQALVLERFDGGHVYVLNSAAPILDQHGRPAGCAVAIQDIGRLIEAERALVRSEVALRDANQEL